ncbi:MAG: phenylalanine--tRNA ligase subunit alpha [Desulfurococcales archaeon]|nr:phenylalanine--tRNA ligase subunit alpha [Desulfurococcales archaeon]
MSKPKVPVSKGEYELLLRLAKAGLAEASLEEASSATGLPKSTLESLLALLADKGLARVFEAVDRRIELTPRGRKALEEGLPEEKLVRLLLERDGRASVEEVKKALGGEAGVAIGIAVRSGLARVSQGFVELAVPPEEAMRRVSVLKELLEQAGQGALEEVPEDLIKRGLARVVVSKRKTFKLVAPPEQLLETVAVEASRLTHEMLRTGSWRMYALRRYNVEAEPPRVYPAMTHYLTDFIEMLRDIMKEMGFREVSGPMVELELYNFDLLFQPQDHPAREIHDTLRVGQGYSVEEKPEPSLLERVARVHSEGWGYKWRQDQALRLVLRSQTTAVSARVLAGRPRAPLRVFTVGRVFRSDVVDATHLPEFHQLDGLDGDYGYTFRELLGVLKEISARLGLEVKFKPAYFPFTEPSVEGYVRLPGGRWLELFGAGMMRPEVLEMAGVDYPVGAWGFGVERLAAVYYGFRDIRTLYTRRLDVLRRRVIDWR